ncbi:hypothetical protein DRQ53_03025 [bacterium]|nr:MAG: hypothetical protein DRQ32_01475 [bacterium]RKZ17628.1 MAG: hypothetical protein DRQ53_03025 [bacterium]
MSDLSFLVRGRSVDLVAMTARRALQTTLGLGDEVLDLMRDQLVCIAGVEDASAAEWSAAIASHQHWFNPNKHRFASFVSADGAFAAIKGNGDWPSPWLREIVDTDRPDLVAARESGKLEDLLAGWMAPPSEAGAFAVSFIAYDLEDGVSRLPVGHWPGSGYEFLQAVLWTIVLRAEDAAAARARAEELLVTRTRTSGMLVHPHMEGYTAVGAARPCKTTTEVQA